MLWRLISNTLLIIHFYLPEPYKEQCLALQTLSCVTIKGKKPEKVLTLSLLVIYFIQTKHQWEFFTCLAHHFIVFCCVIGEYYFKERNYWSWIFLFWSVRWLSSLDIYEKQAWRACLRCMLFIFISQGHYLKTTKNGLRWIWILMVHEIAWCLLPVQMLYEVYCLNKKENLESIV